MNRRLFWVLCVQVFAALALSLIAFFRTPFSLRDFAGFLPEERASEIEGIFSKKYCFLGRGKQAFVFESEDGISVIKFFNRRYFEVPWFLSYIPKELQKLAFGMRENYRQISDRKVGSIQAIQPTLRSLIFDVLTYPKSQLLKFLGYSTQEKERRDKRKNFFLQGYLLADAYCKDETALVYTHFGPTHTLPCVVLTDWMGRSFPVDLNRLPFVLQKKVEPFYPALAKGGVESECLLQQFFCLIAHRIGCGLADGDQEIEKNFGLLEGKLVHLDPGRLTRCPQLCEPNRWEHEWKAATHRLRKWLQRHHPELLPSFEENYRSFLMTSSSETCSKTP